MANFPACGDCGDDGADKTPGDGQATGSFGPPDAKTAGGLDASAAGDGPVDAMLE